MGEAVEVAADAVVVALFEELEGFLGDGFAVVAAEAKKIELHSDAALMQAVVVALIHIDVALGVGEYREIAGREDGVDDAE